MQDVVPGHWEAVFLGIKVDFHVHPVNVLEFHDAVGARIDKKISTLIFDEGPYPVLDVQPVATIKHLPLRHDVDEVVCGILRIKLPLGKFSAALCYF